MVSRDRPLPSAAVPATLSLAVMEFGRRCDKTHKNKKRRNTHFVARCVQACAAGVHFLSALPLIELKLIVNLQRPSTFLRIFQQLGGMLRTLQLTGGQAEASEERLTDDVEREESDQAWLQECKAQAQLQAPPRSLRVELQATALR